MSEFTINGVTLPKELTANEVIDYSYRYEMSRFKAKVELGRERQKRVKSCLIEATDNATNLEELKEVIKYMIGKNSLEANYD